MARSLRIQYPGAYYHVMARGNRREDIVRDDDDRKCFVETLGEACAMAGWRVHAWVLMSKLDQRTNRNEKRGKREPDPAPLEELRGTLAGRA